MILADAIDGRAPDAPVLIGAGRRVTAASLRALPRDAAATGGRVAVCCSDPVALIETLFALDGAAAELLLLPPSLAPEQAADFAERAASQWQLGDGALALPRRPPATAVAAAPHATRWLLTTSGTTGTPKIVPHTLAALVGTTRRDPAHGASLVWGLLYDPTRFAGLQVVLQALFGGSTLVVPDPAPSFAERMACLAAHGVNALSATPTMWRQLLMAGAAARLDLRTVTLGGEMADQKILDALRAAWPAARVRHVYASTEAGVGFSVADGEDGFPAAWLQKAPAGLALRIVGDGAVGELQLRSSRAAAGYVGGAALADADGWVASGDWVANDGRRVRFLGRRSGAINVGGDKVFPESVERVLTAHPAVFSATVRGRKSPITGALVEAEVVLAPTHAPAPALRDELLAHCRARLPRHAVPALLRFGAAPIATAAGKQQRTPPTSA